MKALGRLEAREVAPAVARFLSHDRGSFRVIAAETLCRLGRREGIPTMLRESFDLIPMSALRVPDAYRRLSGRVWKGELKGKTEDLLAQIARQADLKLELRVDDTDRHAMQRSRFVGAGHGDVLETTLRAVLRDHGLRFEALVERDRLVIVPFDEALEFWHSWWRRVPKQDR